MIEEEPKKEDNIGDKKVDNTDDREKKETVATPKKKL